MVNNLLQRVSTGLVFLIIVISCIIWNIYSLASLFFVVAILSLWEFYTMVRAGEYRPQIISGIITGSLFYILIYLIHLGYFPISSLTLGIPFFAGIFIAELYRKKNHPFINIALTILGILYIVIPFSLVNLFAFIDIDEGYSAGLVLGFFILIWLNDTFAYIFGRWLGKRKLFPAISPNKTWEGAIGGGLATLAGSLVLYNFFPRIERHDWLIIGIIISITGIYGDLIESMLKRHFQTKDSGKILPGHGGMLDRFDGVLLASPMVFAYLVLFVF